MGTACSVPTVAPRQHQFPGMERWRGKAALVTGASSGIGYAIAKQLTELGMNVVGCARNTEALSSQLSLASGKLMVEKCDMRSEQEIISVFQAAKAYFGGVDVCISCAELTHDAPLLSGCVNDWREMLEVNIIGTCICTREFVKQQRERGVEDGHIILINSIDTSGSRNHFPLMISQAIATITEGVRHELRGMNCNNINTTAISPDIIHKGRTEEVEEDSAKKLCEQGMEPNDIARTIVYILSTPPKMQIRDIVVRFTTKETDQ